MTAAELITQADALRPNQYTQAEKLGWLSRLDGQIYQELLSTHAGAPEEPAESYTGDTVLLVGAPWAGELYTAYLFAQIDLNNAEIEKYDQSAALFGAAWRQYADWINRNLAPLGQAAFRF